MKVSKPNKSITIYDIAKMADVSVATVSRVLSKSDYPVSAELRERVLKVAEKHRYIPNMLGKQLKTNKNMMIGVIIPTITNPFYPAVVLGVEEMARKNNYHVLLSNSMQDPELEDIYLEAIFERQIKGLVISSISNNRELLKNLMDRGLKVVALDQKLDLEGVGQVSFGFRKGGYLATKFLLDKGHRKIAYVTAPLNRYSRKNIYSGYKDALEEYGVPLNDDFIQISKQEQVLQDGSFEFENGRELTRRLLGQSEVPTAIFACNDMTALGVINELAAQGMKVPEDMSVMGFDNIEFAQMTQPGLTTIKQPNYEMGKLACHLLVDMMQDKNHATGGGMDIVLQPQVVERGTVSPI